LALNNFNSRYQRGGLPPPGGAEVDITFVPNRQVSVQQAFTEDLSESKLLNRGQVTIDGSVGTHVVYEEHFGPYVTANEAVYVPRGRYLYKFFLTFQAGDPAAKKFGFQFQQMLNSVRFQEPP